jgi:hypothetical protein
MRAGLREFDKQYKCDPETTGGLLEAILRGGGRGAPDNALVQERLGVFLLETGQSETAHERLRIAVERNGEDLESRLRLGDACVALGRTAEADGACGRVIELRWSSWEASEASEKRLTNRAVEVFQGRVRSWSPEFDELTAGITI